MSRAVHTRPFAHPAHRAGRLQRLAGVLLGLSVLAVWDPLAHPGPVLCPLRHAVGLPCPLCGLTRGLALALRGRLREATFFNPLSVPLLAVAVLLGVKWALEYATGRQFQVVYPRRLARAGLLAAHALVLGAWVYLLVWRREDDFAACWLGRLLGK
jgi:hypothetical protein